MKASSAFKAYLWLELGFMTYLLFRKKDPGTSGAGALYQLETKLKETIENAVTQNPQATPPPSPVD